MNKCKIKIYFKFIKVYKTNKLLKIKLKNKYKNGS